MPNRIYPIIGSVSVLLLFFGADIFLDLEKPQPITDSAVEQTRPFSIKDNELEAKAALVYDFKEGKILFAKEPYAQLPLASLTKLMTAAVVLDKIPEGASVPVTEEDLEPEGDSGLKSGQTYPRDQLLSLMLTNSSNDSARALSTAAVAYANPETLEISADYAETLRRKVAELGLQETYFLNETGLDESIAVAGAYGSAYDVAMLLGYVTGRSPKVLETTTTYGLILDGKELKNTNQNAPLTTGLISSKTGFTDLAGGNLAVILDVGLMHPVAIVVLGSSEEGRFKDVNILKDELISRFAPNE